MSFTKLFHTLSYAAVFCGFLSLWVSGTFGITGTGLFILVMVAAWRLEGSQWQISERLGTVLIVAALPLFYLAFRFRLFDFGDSGTMVAGILARLILSLTAIKLLQRKSDRDWIFLYMMAFFEVLLAAGLSISALYLFSFVLYIFVMICTIIVFEIKKTEKATTDKLSVSGRISDVSRFDMLPMRRLPLIAGGLIICILLLAIPMFFLLPRVGGAGIGGNNSGSDSTSAGFADSVELGNIGTIQQNDAVVMRARVENDHQTRIGKRWRGIALDTFNNKGWSKTRAGMKEQLPRGERDLIPVDYSSGRGALTLQTIYLEPLDRPVLFVLPRAIGVQGNFPLLERDPHGAISFQRVGERITYKVLSDRALPDAASLRGDRDAYSRTSESYLQLPSNIDPRIRALAEQITRGVNNRYDAALAMESYLQNNFGYTLDQKASGEQPLADFLFNIREGHCEYFATAMAIMLRTQGIATRVVNGFQQGEYNETADVYVVRQRNAHSWVEVYFPGENTWIPFDPTPFAGQNLAGTSFGLTARFNTYFEALQMFWIQYFVAFDNQEQRSLFTSFKRGFSDYQDKTSSYLGDVQAKITEWWSEVRGEKGLETSLAALGRGALMLAATVVGVLLFVWLYRKVVKLKVWRKLWDRLFAQRHASIVEFYDRMQTVLASKGFTREPHQTPLEFAFALGMPEAVRITELYNSVRFGKRDLTDEQFKSIEESLNAIRALEP